MKTECDIWSGAKSGNGYGYKRDGKNLLRAHIYAYTKQVGPVPDGLELDHLCNEPLCVNVEHLEPVSHKINTQRRSERMWEKRAGKCKHGHSADNIFLNANNKKSCRECIRQANNRSRSKNL